MMTDKDSVQVTQHFVLKRLNVSSGYCQVTTRQTHPGRILREYLAHNVSYPHPRMTLTKQDESLVIKGQDQVPTYIFVGLFLFEQTGF